MPPRPAWEVLLEAGIALAFFLLYILTLLEVFRV